MQSHFHVTFLVTFLANIQLVFPQEKQAVSRWRQHTLVEHAVHEQVRPVDLCVHHGGGPLRTVVHRSGPIVNTNEHSTHFTQLSRMVRFSQLNSVHVTLSELN